MSSNSCNSNSQDEVERIRNSSNPYDVLGVSQNATTQEIKSAYRKLALRHHPDKQPINGTADSNAQASQLFVKIGAAYEILSNDEARRKFDEEEILGRRNISSNDPFFDFGLSGFGFGRPASEAFTDPFDLFANAFGADPFERQFRQHQRQRHSSKRRHRDECNDPFNDPFFNISAFGFGTQGMRANPFAQMEQRMRQMHGQGRGFSFSSSSMHTTNFGNAHGQVGESISTTTSIVNGHRVTRTERVKIKPDGTIERHVETLPASKHESLENHPCYESRK